MQDCLIVILYDCYFLELMDIIAAIIHLGDVDFNQIGEKQCTVKTKNALGHAARLMQVRFRSAVFCQLATHSQVRVACCHGRVFAVLARVTDVARCCCVKVYGLVSLKCSTDYHLRV